MKIEINIHNENVQKLNLETHLPSEAKMIMRKLGFLDKKPIVDKEPSEINWNNLYVEKSAFQEMIQVVFEINPSFPRIAVIKMIRILTDCSLIVAKDFLDETYPVVSNDF